jgi:murein DD-endopeptidase MepM/ murein hydrolase activator NlpD
MRLQLRLRKLRTSGLLAERSRILTIVAAMGATLRIAALVTAAVVVGGLPANADAGTGAPDTSGATGAPAAYGGTAAGDPAHATTTVATGGATYGQPLRLPPLPRVLRVSPTTLTSPGTAPKLSLRIDGPAAPVRVRLEMTKTGSTKPAATLDLGLRATRRTRSVTWAALASRTLAGGRYRLTLVAVDTRGHALARSAATGVTVKVKPKPVAKPAPKPKSPPTSSGQGDHRFPVAGSYSYGDGFGVDRVDHIHMGQDLAAAEGTPLVAPYHGTISVRSSDCNNAAGCYVVLAADDGRSYVFFHMLEGSVVVSEGQRVATGQRIGEVGTTGRSTGPHLHFEVWIDGPWQAGGHAVDPLPFLKSWER